MHVDHQGALAADGSLAAARLGVDVMAAHQVAADEGYACETS